MKEYRWKIRMLLTRWGNSQTELMHLRKQIEDMNDEVKAVTDLKSPAMTGMPGAKKINRETENKALKLADIENEYNNRLTYLTMRIKETIRLDTAIDQALHELPNENLESVIRLRYQIGYKYEKIAYDTSYSVDRIKHMEQEAVDILSKVIDFRQVDTI